MGIKRTELIRQIDLWPSKWCFRSKIGQKRQKYRKPNFPLYFWQNPLYFFNGLLGSLNGLKWIFCRKQTLSKIQFHIGIHLNEIQILHFENMLTPNDHSMRAAFNTTELRQQFLYNGVQNAFQCIFLSKMTHPKQINFGWVKFMESNGYGSTEPLPINLTVQ